MRLAFSTAVMIALATASGCTRVLDLGDRPDAVAVSDAGCGEGTQCRAGVMCTRTCESCFCNDKQEWYCSATCAEDAGVTCPATTPADRSACTSTATRCTYPNGCGTVDLAFCVDAQWETFLGPCKPPPGCPPSPPMPGMPCPPDVTLDCQFQNRCGLFFFGHCSPSLPAWQIDPPPPCPDTGCPPGPPPVGAPCTGDVKCSWTNACATTDYGICRANAWSITRTCVPQGCPVDEPPVGAPCPAEGRRCAWPGACETGAHRAVCEQGAWNFDRGCT